MLLSNGMQWIKSACYLCWKCDKNINRHGKKLLEKTSWLFKNLCSLRLASGSLKDFFTSRKIVSYAKRLVSNILSYQARIMAFLLMEGEKALASESFSLWSCLYNGDAFLRHHSTKTGNALNGLHFRYSAEEDIQVLAVDEIEVWSTDKHESWRRAHQLPLAVKAKTRSA